MLSWSCAELASTGQSPVATPHGVGQLQSGESPSLGMLACTGPHRPTTHPAVRSACRGRGRFDDRVTGSTKAFAEGKDIHIDIDPSNIAKCVRADIPIVGDARTVLTALAEGREHRTGPRADHNRGLEARCAAGYDAARRALSHSVSLRELSRQTAGDAVITTGVGQHRCGRLSSMNSADRGS